MASTQRLVNRPGSASTKGGVDSTYPGRPFHQEVAHAAVPPTYEATWPEYVLHWQPGQAPASATSHHAPVQEVTTKGDTQIVLEKQ